MSVVVAWAIIFIGGLGAVLCAAALVNRAASWQECCECGRTWDWLGGPGIPPASAPTVSFTCPRCLRERAQAEADIVRSMKNQPTTNKRA